MGIEAVEWVSNSNVAGKLFDQNTNKVFDPSNYPNEVADIDSKLGGAWHWITIYMKINYG